MQAWHWLLIGGAAIMAAKNIRTLPAGVRNNNPGNLMDFGIPWEGLIGRDEKGRARFATPLHGARAMYIDLRTGFQRDGENTVREIITEWAPPPRNPTERYIAFVSEWLGVGPDEPLELARVAVPLMQAIAHFENGYDPHGAELYVEAIRLA